MSVSQVLRMLAALVLNRPIDLMCSFSLGRPRSSIACGVPASAKRCFRRAIDADVRRLRREDHGNQQLEG